MIQHLVNEDEEGAPLGEGAVNYQLLAITENINLVRVNTVELEAATVGGGADRVRKSDLRVLEMCWCKCELSHLCHI